MGLSASDDEVLVSLADVAALAGFSRPAISNWRSRHKDFPAPVRESGASALFRLGDIRAWMARHGKKIAPHSVDEAVWSLLNRARGSALPEDLAHVGLVLLGCVAVSKRSGPDLLNSIEDAIRAGRNTEVRHLLEEAARLAPAVGISDAIGGLFARDQPMDLPPFLHDLTALTRRFGEVDVFEALLAALARSPRGGDEFATPPGLARLMASLAEPLEGTVLDFASGRASILLAAKALGGEKVKLVGRDVNVSACHTARMRMLIHGIDAQIEVGDTLAAVDDSYARADVVISDPPFGAQWHPELLRRDLEFGKPPRNASDLAWVQRALELIRPNGEAILAVRMGVLFNSGVQADIRRRLVQAGSVRAVIALPAGLYSTTAIPVAILVLGRPRRHANNDILMLDASRLGRGGRTRTELSDEQIAAITSCYHSIRLHGDAPATAMELAAGFVPVEAILAGGGSLVPARWLDPSSAGRREAEERIDAAARQLHDMHTQLNSFPLEIPRAVPGEGRDQRRMSIAAALTHGLLERIATKRIDPELRDTGDTPLILPRDISRSFDVRPGSRIDTTQLPDSPVLTQPGDLLIVEHGLRVAVDRTGGAVASAPIQVLRPRSDLVDPVVLAAAISSAARRTAAAGVPLPDIEIVILPIEECRQLRSALENLIEYRRRAHAAVEAADELLEAAADALAAGGLRVPTSASSPDTS